MVDLGVVGLGLVDLGVVGLEIAIQAATAQHEELAVLDCLRRRGMIVQDEDCNSVGAV